MNKTLTLFFGLLALNVLAQIKQTKEVQSIVSEGKKLYKIEMTSRNGAEIFMAIYKESQNIGGYFSYSENENSTCVFFSKSESPKVIGSLVFDNTWNTKTVKTDLSEREFSPQESEIYQIRKLALIEINSDAALFKTIENTNLILIPIVGEKEKKIYVVTQPTKSGVVLFGNDYLLVFDKNNKLLQKNALHQQLKSISYDGKEQISMHNHLHEASEYITATDICTLMLYEKIANWKTHNAVSEKYFNIWNCDTNELTIMSTETEDNED